MKKNLLRYCGILIITFLIYSCEKDRGPEPEPEPEMPPSSPYGEIESIIRKEFDACALFTWDEYELILAKLAEPKFNVLPINEMRSTFDNSKVIVGLRHDVDFNAFKALEMAKIEKKHNVRSTFYFLATAQYYGQFVNSEMKRSTGIDYLFKEVHEAGAEIGIHNDLLAVMIIHKIDPLKFNKAEIAFYNSLDIPVYGTASHGSEIAKQLGPNYQMFSDFAKKDSVEYNFKKYPIGEHSLHDYGYKYETYFIDFGTYLSDSGGKWNVPDGLGGVLKKLNESRPGDRIQILIHPDWWGRKPPPTPGSY